jgi:gliding motility-associated-like protein
MKKITLQRFRTLSLFLFASVLVNQSANAQCTNTCGPNLIPNPDLEATDTYCTAGTDRQIYYDKTPVKSWYGLQNSTHNQSGLAAGYVNPNCPNAGNESTCNGGGVGQIQMSTTWPGRESVQAKLATPLKAGHSYCFSMVVKSSNLLPTPGSDGIGAWFHKLGKIDINAMNGGADYLGPGSTINATPQIQNASGNIISNCYTLTGTFCANGGEEWIVISNFRTLANTKVGGGGTGSGNASVLLIDNISLVENKCLTNPTGLTTTADSVCPGSCVTLTANPVGGSGSYTYLWSPGGETTKSISACPTADATKYKCKISSSFGCAIAASISDSVTIFFKKYIPIPTITTSTSSTICAGDTITLTCTPAAPNYLWSTGATTQSIKVTTAGSYSVTVKHPYSACNSTSAGTNVVVNAVPVLKLTSMKNDSTNCDKPTGSITGITATGTPTLKYSWNSNPVQTTPDLINVPAGIYTLTVTDGNGCKKTATEQIFNKQSPPAPTIDLGSTTTTVCTENDIKLVIKNPSPGYTYTWTQLPSTVKGTGDVLILKDAKPSDTGVYQVTATKLGCEGAGSTINITVNQTPDTVVLKAVSGTVCEGTKAILFVNPPADPNLTYKWISPDSPNTPDVINDSLIINKVQLKDAGIYKLVAISKLSCPSHDAHIKLAVDSAAKNSKVTLSNNVICEGDTVKITPSTPIAGITYKIYVKTTSGDSLVGIAPLDVTPHKTTTYFMDAVTTKGCSQTAEKDTATVTVYSAPRVPVVSATDSVICDNDSTTIFVANPIAGVTYKIYDAPVGGNGYNTPYTVVLHKTTTFYLEAISSKSCIQITGRRPITITVNPLPDRPKITVETKPDNKLCNGETAKLTSSVPNNITWLPGNLHTQSITVSTGGIYTLHFTDQNGCSSYKDSTKITLVEPPKLDVSNYGIDTVRCNATIGGVHGLVVNSGTGPFTYKWYDVKDPNTTISTDLVLKGVPTGKYTLVVTDKNGCTDVLSNVFIPTRGGIVAHLSANPSAGVAPLDVVATATIGGVGKPVEYVWYLDGINKGTTTEKSNTYPFGNLPFGTHVIQVTVTDTNQCKSIDYITVTVLTSVKIKDVNIFTPNNDGENDILIFPMEGVQTLQGTIFDRWGLKLFEWSGADKGWDGNDQSGKAVPEGTYYYILRTTDVYGGSRVKSGYVELIRK